MGDRCGTRLSTGLCILRLDHPGALHLGPPLVRQRPPTAGMTADQYALHDAHKISTTRRLLRFLGVGRRAQETITP